MMIERSDGSSTTGNKNDVIGVVDSTNVEYEIFESCKAANYDSLKINIKKADEFAINSRNQRLHIRSFWPQNDVEVRGIIIFLHGYAAHGNRPTQPYVSSQFLNKGFGYITFDFHGHGYSEGMRCLINQPKDMVDDCVAVLKAFYDHNVDEKKETTDSKCKVNRQLSSDIPFFLMGQSIGGAVALLTGQYFTRLNDNQVTNSEEDFVKRIAPLFKGYILLSPAFEVKTPSPIVLTLLDYFVVPFFGENEIPSILKPNENKWHLAWKNESYVQYIINDGNPQNPNGLSYTGGMRFRTAKTMLNIITEARDLMSEVTSPFIVFHDPEDEVTKYEGTKKLFQDSKTVESKKELVDMKNGLHDVLSNELTFVTDRIVKWVEKIMDDDSDTTA